jgi:hypothetical protein
LRDAFAFEKAGAINDEELSCSDWRRQNRAVTAIEDARGRAAAKARAVFD